MDFKKFLKVKKKKLSKELKTKLKAVIITKEKHREKKCNGIFDKFQS